MHTVLVQYADIGYEHIPAVHRWAQHVIQTSPAACGELLYSYAMLPVHSNVPVFRRTSRWGFVFKWNQNDSGRSGVSVWSPAAKFPCPVCLSLQRVPAVTLCVSCLFGFALCLNDFSIMKCHLPVKTGLIKYILSKCVWVSMYLCVWHHREWQLGWGVTLQAFFSSPAVPLTAHLDDKAPGDVSDCSNTNQIHIFSFGFLLTLFRLQ